MEEQENNLKQENNIRNELCDIQWDIIDSLDVLIKAEWDAPQVKIKLSRLLKQHYTLCDELDELAQRRKA